MELKDTLTIAATIVLAFTGWIIAHRNGIKQTIDAKRREIRVNNLKEAYLILSACADKETFEQGPADFWSNVREAQKALNIIQIFGSPHLIEEVQNAFKAYNETRTFTLNDLIMVTRNEIRAEIGLKPVEGLRWAFRRIPEKV